MLQWFHALHSTYEESNVVDVAELEAQGVVSEIWR